MRYLSTHVLASYTSDATTLFLTRARDELGDDIRKAQGKGKKGRRAADQTDAAGSDPSRADRSLDLAETFERALDAVQHAPASSSTAMQNTNQTTRVLAFDVLQLVLQRSVQLSTSTPSSPSPDLSRLQIMFRQDLLESLADTLYGALDPTSGPTAQLSRARESMAALLDLDDMLHGNTATVAKYLRAKIMVEPWNKKRTLGTFKLIAGKLKVDELSDFALVVDDDVSMAEDEDTAEGVLRRLVRGMAASDETATLQGSVALAWIEKSWSEQKERGATDATSALFWIKPVANAIRNGGERGRNNIPQYLLVELFRRRRTAFKELMTLGGFLDFGHGDESEVEAALAILKIGNAQGLVELDAQSADDNDDKKLALPSHMLEACLHHASPSLRCSAFSLLVVASSTSLALADTTWPLLRAFYIYSLGTEDAEFRMASTALSGKLLLRLRDSSWKAQRRLVKRAGDVQASSYVHQVKGFIEWWCGMLLSNLNPAKPFRIKMNALRLLDLVLQANVDHRFVDSTVAFSSKATSSSPAGSGYALHSRRSAPASQPQFQTQHRKIDGDAAAGQNSARSWPFEIDVVNASTTSALLRCLQSTYTALRSLSISLLEHFPSPLPGYEDVGRVRAELLVPGLRLVRSGREAEASAGAGVVGLVWRKWVFENGEGSAAWNLGEVGGWTESATSGPTGFAFLNSLMDLAETQLRAYSADLSRAASTTPMHGTLLAIRHLLVSVPRKAYWDTSFASPAETRALFTRALRIVEGVWDVTKVVLAASAPEGAVETNTADTEEARAIRLEEGEDGDTLIEGVDGHGGPMHKIILSATWRAMKEAGELLETIVRLPSELGASLFQAIWRLDDVEHIGTLFATWLARIRHRGAFMALAPCYSRASAALLQSKDWPEVQTLPLKWLDSHLDAILSQKISITRRSAGIPYCIIGLLAVILPTDKPAFDRAFLRLFEIAETKASDVLDESRVHAMNTLRTAFLDAKTAAATAPYVERGFLLSISMFWSANWICRNVAMMTYASLVTRSFGAKRTNLDRNASALATRMTAADFFSRYPKLHDVLLKELAYSSREHLNDLPTSDLNSSLFSILMLLSLLQTTNRVSGVLDSPSDAFIPIVKACASSRVWKIRDAAGDAMTGLVPPLEVASVCADLLASLAGASENEIHGRLVQVLRLLEASPQLTAQATGALCSALQPLTSQFLNERHSFAVRTTFFSIVRQASLRHGYESAPLMADVGSILDSARLWSSTSAHLPSAENFVTAAYALALLHAGTAPRFMEDGLTSPFIEVQRLTMNHLLAQAAESPLSAMPTELIQCLISLAQADDAASELRISAVDLVANTPADLNTFRSDEMFAAFLRLKQSIVIVPLQEALLPLIARLSSLQPGRLDAALDLIEPSSSPFESIEAREAAARALCQLGSSATDWPRFGRVLLRLLQDDDVTVREHAERVVARTWIGGQHVSDRRSVEIVLRAISSDSSYEQTRDEFEYDMALLSKPSSLLFAVEKPNIFKDDLLESEVQHSLDETETAVLRQRLEEAVAQGKAVRGPLGLDGDELYCKWKARLWMEQTRP